MILLMENLHTNLLLSSDLFAPSESLTDQLFTAKKRLLEFDILPTSCVNVFYSDRNWP